jgi:Tol biopolymer transport system component
MQFNPGVADASAQLAPIVHSTGTSVISPDGKWIAFTAAASGRKRILLRKLSEKNAIALTGGNCNSFAPAWDLDSRGIVFASDCGRGIGLPALYRARLSAIPVR